MPIFVSVFVILLTAITLLILRFTRPDFRYPWTIAAGGSLVALLAVFLSHLQLPQTVSPVVWGPRAVFPYALTWISDDASWPNVLSLAALAAAATDRYISWCGVRVDQGSAVSPCANSGVAVRG
jgi:hypothetical protein